MSENSQYLQKLRGFWEIDDPTELKFNRVETLYGNDRTEELFNKLSDERVDWILRDLNLPEAPRILEIGCGIGAVLDRILGRIPNASIVGLDISRQMIAAATEALKDRGKVELHVSNGDSLAGIPDRSMDLVICTGVFIHITNIDVIKNYLSEVRRVLKPGAAFRFNGRYWNPMFSFGNSLGGRLAKFLHKIGWRSALKKTTDEHGKCDFNGIYFTSDDVENLVYSSGMSVEQLIIDNTSTHKPGGYFRANCRLHAT